MNMKRNVTLLLMGLILISPLSCLFAVVCQGSDGHVAIEVAIHDHCACDSETATDSPTFGDSSSSHSHCIDTSVEADYLTTSRKNLIFTAHCHFSALPNTSQISIISLSSTEHPKTLTNDRSTFYAPLRTIILLS